MKYRRSAISRCSIKRRNSLKYVAAHNLLIWVVEASVAFTLEARIDCAVVDPRAGRRSGAVLNANICATDAMLLLPRPVVRGTMYFRRNVRRFNLRVFPPRVS